MGEGNVKKSKMAALLGILLTVFFVKILFLLIK